MIPSQYLRAVRLRRHEVPSFRRYPFHLPAVRNLDSLALHPAVTFLIGENGSGKSTLLEAIAVAWGFNAEGGSRNFRFATRSSHSELFRYLELERGTRRAHDGYFLRAESFYNVATEIERIDGMDMAQEPPLGRPVREDHGGRSLHEQSHGESFFALLTERFTGGGLYLLDEPEAALSPTRQMAALVRIHDLAPAWDPNWSSPRTPPSSWRTRRRGSTCSTRTGSGRCRTRRPSTSWSRGSS